MDARTAMERLRTMLPGWTSPTIPISTDAAKKLLDAFDEMARALETTRGNIMSLGPAGALDQVPMPYREWLAVVETALAKARP